MKVILATIHLESSTRSIPLAAACLKAEIKDHEVLLRNYTLEQSAEEIQEALLRDGPDILGFPVYLWNRSLVLDIISLIKTKNPLIPILAGGPEVTAAPLPFLNESGITCVMQGEGEVMINPVLEALSRNIPIPGIPGVWTKTLIPEGPAYCGDLNSLVSPILSGALDLRANNGLLWELSRGCPFACEFCFESKGSGKVRYFSLGRVRKELEMIRDFGVSQVFVLDPTFNVNKKRVMTILDWIMELTPSTYYYFEVRTEFLDEESAAAFASIPCTLQIGLQSSDPEVLRLMNRHFDPDSFREKVALLSNAGVSFGLDLIYGLPGDTLAGFRNSLNYTIAMEPNHLDLFPLAVLPGTVLFERKEELRIHSDVNDPYLILDSDRFSAAEMKTADEIRKSTESLYNQGRGISWFSRVCYDLDLKPVEIIDFWSDFMKEAGARETEILRFLESLYNMFKKDALFPVLRDLFRYLDLLDELEQLEGVAPPEGIFSFTENDLFSLHESVRFSVFSIPPDLILDGFPASSEELMSEAGYFKVLLWVRQQGVCMDLLDQEEMKILTLLREQNLTIRDLSQSSSVPDLEEFLFNGIQEGYLCRN